MKSLKEQIENKCIHFTGMINKECKKGVKYEDVKVKTERPFKIPCLLDSDLGTGSCAFCEFPSPEQVKKEVDEIKERGRKMMGAYSAVKGHYEKHKKRKNKMECPDCKGDLHYTVAKINGHIWAKCSGCGLGWME